MEMIAHREIKEDGRNADLFREVKCVGLLFFVTSVYSG